MVLKQSEDQLKAMDSRLLDLQQAVQQGYQKVTLDDSQLLLSSLWWLWLGNIDAPYTHEVALRSYGPDSPSFVSGLGYRIHPLAKG